MKFYLAGHSREQWRPVWRRLADELEAAGHVCTHRWFDPEVFDKDGLEVALELDKVGVADAEVFIGVFDAGCKGAVWEAGFAQGRGVPVVAVLLEREDGSGVEHAGRICDFLVWGRGVKRIRFDPVKLDGLGPVLCECLRS